MSFHGGLLGVVVAGCLFCRNRGIPTLAFADLIFCATPFGLFFGRLANFVNGELAGRPTSVPWAMVFPHYGPLPRHPSQLYQAALEGVVLFVVLFLLWRRPGVRNRPGWLSGAFLVGYGVLRGIGELFREPDAHLGFLWGGLTMGQLLSLPLIAFGLWLISRAQQRPPAMAGP
jgi:phosphatidylglycerol:prolipoprotein diacylglycerol transferase